MLRSCLALHHQRIHAPQARRCACLAAMSLLISSRRRPTPTSLSSNSKMVFNRSRAAASVARHSSKIREQRSLVPDRMGSVRGLTRRSFHRIAFTDWGSLAVRMASLPALLIGWPPRYRLARPRSILNNDFDRLALGAVWASCDGRGEVYGIEFSSLLTRSRRRMQEGGAGHSINFAATVTRKSPPRQRQADRNLVPDAMRAG